MRTDELHFKVPGIISSLARMAVKGWPRRPSIKQARAAELTITRWRAEEEGAVLVDN